MKRKPNSPPIVLPARMSLKPDALQNFEIAVLDFPYQAVVKSFLTELQRLLHKDWLERWQYPPYRLLNSAIVACTPTVVHGFESEFGVRRMLGWQTHLQQFWQAYRFNASLSFRRADRSVDSSLGTDLGTTTLSKEANRGQRKSFVGRLHPSIASLPSNKMAEN